MPILNVSEPDIPDAMGQYQWVPVLLKPIVGSAERLVIGAVAHGDDGLYFASANALERLECLYGKSAAVTQVVAETAFDKIRESLGGSEVKAFNGRDLGPHVELGEWQMADGRSAKEVAQRWLSVSSSFYSIDRDELHLVAEYSIETQQGRSLRRREKLRADVFEYIAKARPRIASNFSEAVRKGRSVRRASGAISIDYSGDRLTANIEDVGSSQIWSTTRNIKERLWDLRVARDAHKRTKSHSFEMLVCAESSLIEPHKQAELLEELTEQADQEEIRLRQFSKSADLGQHILKFEAA